MTSDLTTKKASRRTSADDIADRITSIVKMIFEFKYLSLNFLIMSIVFDIFNIFLPYAQKYL